MKCVDTIPHLEENFLRVLRDRTAGDPMRQGVRWTDRTYAHSDSARVRDHASGELNSA
jgi:hypothetical protein